MKGRKGVEREVNAEEDDIVVECAKRLLERPSNHMTEVPIASFCMSTVTKVGNA